MCTLEILSFSWVVRQSSGISSAIGESNFLLTIFKTRA